MPKKSTQLIPSITPLLKDVRELILTAREQVARTVDSSLVTLYWHVGRRVHQDILGSRRAEYGAQIVAAVGRQLEQEFGRGFGEKNLPVLPLPHWRSTTPVPPNRHVRQAHKRGPTLAKHKEFLRAESEIGPCRESSRSR